MTSELSAISPSISAGIATTSETSTTSAASTQGVLPTVYTANPNIGPGGQIHNESKHFRVYGTIPVNVNRTHDLLEGEYDYLSGKPLRTGSQTSNICAPAREKANRSAAASIIEVKKLIGDSIRVVIGGSPSTGNYNQAWPFLAYLVNNPDDVPGLGTPVTPLHILARVASTKIGRIIDSYWARMAFVDIGHAPAQNVFQQ
ncbi:hypothetical protein QWA68_015979 [Fusarium oxysporum]|nr:hypothetical protein QWA68_015979 [Fusarium oxysporum]